MANLHITEHSTMQNAAGVGHAQESAQIPRMPPVADYVVAIGATAAQGQAFNAATRFVCLHAKADCHISIGPTPTATNQMKPLTAGQDYYCGVKPGDKVSVIQA